MPPRGNNPTRKQVSGSHGATPDQSILSRSCHSSCISSIQMTCGHLSSALVSRQQQAAAKAEAEAEAAATRKSDVLRLRLWEQRGPLPSFLPSFLPSAAHSG